MDDGAAKSMKQVFFALTTARTGTLYLSGLFQRNIAGCDCRHEPFFDWGNPTMFGRAIYDAYAGRLDRLRKRLAKKKRYIERLPGSLYLESSHAFLKSAYLAALEFFPDMRLVHLIRNPLQVARSAAYREDWRRRVHAPFHFYTGDDGRRHFVWALTGNEAIFKCFESRPLSLFQWYLLEWIELENRAMRFLDEHQLHGRCFTLHTPTDLNDENKVPAMFQFFGLQPRHDKVVPARRKNRSLGYARGVNPEEESQAAEVLSRLPAGYLEIFQRAPYNQFPWSGRLRSARVEMSRHYSASVGKPTVSTRA